MNEILLLLNTFISIDKLKQNFFPSACCFKQGDEKLMNQNSFKSSLKDMNLTQCLKLL